MWELFTPLHVIFYFFAAVAIGSAICVITARNPVRCVLFLVLTFFAMAGVWMELQAEFLSLILLLVYVGAVMTLFLFVVMMLNIDREESRGGFVKYLPFGVAVVILLTVMLFVAVGPQDFAAGPAPQLPENYNNLTDLGRVLYTDYAYPFEVAGVVLLAAMIASIALTFRGPVRRKSQDPAKQIATRREDSVRLLKMPSSPRPSSQGKSS